MLLGTFDWSLVAREMAEVALGDATETQLLLAVIDQLQLLYASYGADLFVIQGADEPFVLESKNGAGNEFSYGIRTMLMPDTGAPAAGWRCARRKRRVPAWLSRHGKPVQPCGRRRLGTG